MSISLAIFIFLAAVLLNGLFAGYETGFISADPIRIRFLAEKEKHPRAIYLLPQLSNRDRMLTTVLVGTNIALIMGTWTATTTAAELMAGTWIANYATAELLAAIVVTPVFLVFSEIIPKSVFRRHPNRLSMAFLPPIRFFNFILAPFSLPAVWAFKIFRRIIGAEDEHIARFMSTEEDFRSLVDESAARGSIEPEEQEMIHSVMDLQTTLAKEIMVPRIDMAALPTTATRGELVTLFENSGRTRIPLYDDTIDTVVGLVNVYDVLLDTDPKNENITRFAKDVIHVPDTKPVDDLLQELKESKQHMAIVTDEYGGTDGLITLEDILEEIFGEIHDEHDPPQAMIQRVGPRGFVIDARVSLEEVSEAIGTDIADEEVETIGGWVMRGAGRIPAQGEKLTHQGFRITILDGRSNQITKIRLDIPQKGDTTASGEPSADPEGL